MMIQQKEQELQKKAQELKIMRLEFENKKKNFGVK